MLILGVDPGSRRAGYGVIKSDGNRVSRIDSGVFVIENEADMSLRLAALHRGLTEVIARNNPAEAAVEKVFFGYNVKSAIVLGQSRGVVLAALGLHGIKLFEYNPTEIKVSVTRRGRASKDQVRKFVSFILGGYSAIDENEADALAVAICHFHKTCGRTLKIK